MSKNNASFCLLSSSRSKPYILDFEPSELLYPYDERFHLPVAWRKASDDVEDFLQRVFSFCFAKGVLVFLVCFVF